MTANMMTMVRATTTVSQTGAAERKSSGVMGVVLGVELQIKKLRCGESEEVAVILDKFYRNACWNRLRRNVTETLEGARASCPVK
jgi:2-keto-3-deoxy-galactonokinase